MVTDEWKTDHWLFINYKAKSVMKKTYDSWWIMHDGASWGISICSWLVERYNICFKVLDDARWWMAKKYAVRYLLMWSLLVDGDACQWMMMSADEWLMDDDNGQMTDNDGWWWWWWWAWILSWWTNAWMNRWMNGWIDERLNDDLILME